MDEYDAKILNLIIAIAFLILSFFVLYLSYIIGKFKLTDTIMITFIPLFSSITFFIIYKKPRLFGSDDSTFSLMLFYSFVPMYSIELIEKAAGLFVLINNLLDTSQSIVTFIIHYFILTLGMFVFANSNNDNEESND